MLLVFCCSLSPTGETHNVKVRKMDSAGEPSERLLLLVYTSNWDNAHCLAGTGELSEYSKELRLC